jgi:DNA gyrase/topoisomerase IV subunit B
MNAEQLAETTMSLERQTRLQGALGDAVDSDKIYATLMGEDVGSRLHICRR